MNKFNLCEINEKLKIVMIKKYLKSKYFKKLSTSINCQFYYLNIYIMANKNY